MGIVKKVVITGAAGGIGSATVAAFLEAGFQVFGIDRVPMPKTHGVESCIADVTDFDSMQEVVSEFGPIDHVVSIAGGSLLEERETEDPSAMSTGLFRESIEQNLVSAFITLQSCLPQLRQSTGDRSITLTTSTDALVLSNSVPAYVAAKAGIIGIVHSLASTLGGEGIRINAVAPGDVPTSRTSKMWAHRAQWWENLAANNSLQRLCTPEEIAEGYLALSSKLTAMTGQILVMDAGQIGGQIPHTQPNTPN